MKKKLHKIYLLSNQLEDFISFEKQRAMCLRKSRLDQKNYFEEIKKKLKKIPKNFGDI